MRLVSLGGVIRRIFREGVNIGSRPTINLHEGTGIQIVTTDDTVNDEIDVTIASTVSGGVTAHSALTGLAADDHTQYALDTDLSTHAAAADPHTGYRLESADHSHASSGLQGGQVAHTALTAIGTDDHHGKSHVHSADGSGTVAHASLSGISATDHHVAPAAGPDADATVDVPGAAGTASTFARSGHGHKVATDAGVASTQAFGDAASAGTSGTIQRQGHKHAMPAAPTAASVGAATTVHAHAEADVTSLVTDLAGKAATSHAHAESDVTSLTADLAAIITPTRIRTGSGETLKTAGPGDRGPGQVVTGLTNVVGSVLVGVPKIARSNFTVPANYVHSIDGSVSTGPNIQMTTEANATLVTPNLNSNSRLYTPGRG